MAAAIAEQSLGGSRLVDDISAAVHSLHPELAWELGPGRTALHNLTVTPEGNLVLRRLTAQWLASAPPPDQTWEYYASRQATAPKGLEFGGKRFAPEDFRVGYAYDESRERFDVQLFHPLFKKSAQNAVGHVLFLTLDECLGEDDVERWIGAIEPAMSQPHNAIGLVDFVRVVGDAHKTATGDRYTIGQGQSRDGRPVFISINTALKQIDHLDHVFHLVVGVGLRQPDVNGLPGSEEGQQLDAAEDRLLEMLGRNGVQIGRVTWGGRREIHLFVNDPSRAVAMFGGWAQQIAPWTATQNLAFDPEWSAAKTGIYAALAPRR